MPIDFPSNPQNNDTYTYSGTVWTFDGDVWRVSTTSVVELTPTNSFEQINVIGSDSLLADDPNDILEFVAGDNIAITTNTEGNKVIFSAELTGADSFGLVAVSGQPDVEATTTTDVLTLTAGPNISITTNAITKDIIISASTGGEGGPSGVSTGAQNRLAYYASTGAVVQDTGTNLTYNGTNLYVQGNEVLTTATYPRTKFYLAADDSTIRTLEQDESIKFIGEQGISTSSNFEGNITITGSVGFGTFVVDGQDSLTASSAADSVTFVAGENITIATDTETGSITITSTAAGGGDVSSYSTIAVSGQTNLVATTSTDVLTVAAGAGISISTDAANDTLTITSTVAAGVTEFASLDEPNTAGLTIDQIYLPAITMLEVSNVGATAYRFDQYGATNNPGLYAISGTTIAFKLDVEGHPFLIQDGTGTDYDTGLVHVATDGTVNTGSSAQGQTSGTLYWKIPYSVSGTYRYQCSVHAAMVGTVSVKSFAAV
jgi:plastocyanin